MRIIVRVAKVVPRASNTVARAVSLRPAFKSIRDLRVWQLSLKPSLHPMPRSPLPRPQVTITNWTTSSFN